MFKFSLIVAVYNAEKYLNRCLDSVQKQSYRNWECIIINDGSNDSSPDICNEYALADKRFKVIHKENEGVSAARNLGMDNIAGDWVTFIDADDELTPDALTYFAEGIKRFNQASILRGGHKTITTKVIGKDRRAEEWLYTENHAEALKISEATWCSGFLWSTCFRKDILENARFDKNITWCEDHIFTYECMLKAKAIVFVPHIVYNYYLDDTYPVGFGKSLSFKPISFNMAVRSAEKLKNIKLLLTGDNENIIRLVQNQFESMIRFAVYQSFANHNLVSVIKLMRDYPFISIKDTIHLWLGYQKTRIIHTYKLLLHKY